MSGFEVAGIVLRSIPLVISALEHYSDGARTLKRWRSYDGELKSLIRSLNTEMVKFQNVCENLLQGIVPPSRIEEMLNDLLALFGKTWTSPGISSADSGVPSRSSKRQFKI
ncbi:hypothetical protein VTN00DRAFT_9096 [Thermoascus crustaceus]|uniref:uncharacterized protein n=1 Tax=Thermoascus crustaceus TaxID=5088 RepID=UPI00374377C1